MDATDYFKSKEHNDLCERFVEETRLKLVEMTESGNVYQAVSWCIANLSAIPTFMGAMGLSSTTEIILEAALKEASKNAKKDD